MNIQALIQRIDGDMDFAGDAKLTPEEWLMIRRQLSTSGVQKLAAMLRKMHAELRHYTYQRSNRELIAECETVLKEFQ